MTMKMNYVVVRWILLGILGMGLFAFAIHQSPPQSPQERVAFTAEFTETSSIVVGGEIGRSAEKLMYYAVRGDGATSRGSFDNPFHTRQIEFPDDRVHIKVSDLLGLKTTYDYSYIPVTRTTRIQDPMCKPSAPKSVTFVGEDIISGFRAIHYQFPLATVNDGTSAEYHNWYAPDLNCYEVRHINYRRTSQGTLTGVFERSIVKLTIGEPQPDLFAVSEDLREVKPSELGRAVLLAHVRGREGTERASEHMISESAQRVWARQDAKYNMLRNRQLPPRRNKMFKNRQLPSPK